ncbi:MAG TPA: hypothetical protein VK536_08755 [Candidatus Limnocylindrales bacterium]|nr:hypothetical protein [Candidatus Limnocylindrales bacterium]
MDEGKCVPIEQIIKKYGPQKSGKVQPNVHREIDKFHAQLDEKIRSHIAEDMACLQTFPQFSKHLDVAKLQGRKNTYRLRSDDFRIIFEVNKNAKMINVLKISRTEAAYK